MIRRRICKAVPASLFRLLSCLPGPLGLRRGRQNTKKQSGNPTRRKLLECIHVTEAALFLRWQELANDSTAKEERAGMDAAAADLLAVKLHKLGWPGLKTLAVPTSENYLPGATSRHADRDSRRYLAIWPGARF
jgi:hypothetical protein